MSNLDNLVSKIIDDSNKKAKAIIDEANLNAAKIVNTKVEAANAQSEQILSNAKLEAQRTKEQIVAGKRLEIRDSKLLAKQDVIENSFKLAVESMKKMSKEDFAAFLERYLLKLPIHGDEQIIVPKRYEDIDINKINSKLAQNNTLGKLSILKDVKEIDGGFILVREGIENNNTYESLLDYYRAELETAVVENLF